MMRGRHHENLKQFKTKDYDKNQKSNNREEGREMH